MTLFVNISIKCWSILLDKWFQLSKFNLQLDKTTYVSNDAQLVTYLRYVAFVDMEEELVFCQPIITTISVASYFKAKDLFWKQYHSQYTDDANAWSTPGLLCKS